MMLIDSKELKEHIDFLSHNPNKWKKDRYFQGYLLAVKQILRYIEHQEKVAKNKEK